jgi:hypothetical protein
MPDILLPNDLGPTGISQSKTLWVGVMAYNRNIGGDGISMF